MLRTTLTVALATMAVASLTQRAEACGCFAPTTTVTPVVQAGERILFAVRDNKVIAHIQIQYAGDARDFGWLLPVPSVPTLKTGTDELFTRLLDETSPVFTTQGNVKCRPLTLGCGAFASAPISRSGSEDAGTGPAVEQGSVGPYNYAVLSAANKAEMLRWLNDNRYFIPTGTDTAVDPYIAPNSYFLALKLKSDKDAGDITPIVIEYESSYPMIPIVLTSVAAQPNMGVQVWLLGNGRGIPRNYAHVVINDALLDWANVAGVSNYAEVVTRAVAEAPGKHAFVTDYAGPSAPLLLDETRFGLQSELAASATADAFILRLREKRFGLGTALPLRVVSIVLDDLPVPDALAARGVTGQQFVEQLGHYLGTYRTEHPEDFMGYQGTFDAPRLAGRVFTEYVTPIRDAFALFAQWPKLTRLYTTLSPEDMTVDPVFAFNASLPDVSHRRTAQQDFGCGETEVITEQGWKVKPSTKLDGLPAALSIANVGEEGSPTILTNNVAVIRRTVPLDETAPLAAQQQGCTTDPFTLLSIAAVLAFARRAAVRSSRR